MAIATATAVRNSRVSRDNTEALHAGALSLEEESCTFYRFEPRLSTLWVKHPRPTKRHNLLSKTFRICLSRPAEVIGQFTRWRVVCACCYYCSSK